MIGVACVNTSPMQVGPLATPLSDRRVVTQFKMYVMKSVSGAAATRSSFAYKVQMPR